MKPLKLLVFFLAVMIPLVWYNDAIDGYKDLRDENVRQAEKLFISAADDIGIYMAQLEMQQTVDGIRYTKEKQLAVDLSLLDSFYSNLALKFGVEGDLFETQNLISHIPVMFFIDYDGYRVITLRSQGDGFVPSIGPKKPFFRSVANNSVVYFTMDNNIIYFSPTGTGVYLEGLYTDIMSVRNISPITNSETFDNYKKTAIGEILKGEMLNAINKHNELFSLQGLPSNFYLPSLDEGFTINGPGFYAFIQGYPIPGGELLSTYALGNSKVGLIRKYRGVILASGKHMAYGEGCTIPFNSLEVETLSNDQEAARKGYFIQDCN